LIIVDVKKTHHGTRKRRSRAGYSGGVQPQKPGKRNSPP
jgi:hypothetical protein